MSQVIIAEVPQAPTLPVAPALTVHLDVLRDAAAILGSWDLSLLDACDAAAAHDALRRVGDQLGAVRARLLARIEADGRWASSGSARTFPDWVAGRGGTSVGAARRDAALGKVLEDDAPTAATAVARGEISLEHAGVLSRYASTSEVRRAALASDRSDRNEAYLVEAAKRLGVDDFARLTRRWAAAVDTAAHEREHAAATEREFLRLTRRPDGVDIQGFLAAENAELLATALRAVGGVPAADDARAPERRRAAALTDLARTVLDRGLGGAGKALVRPHLLVHVPVETFAALSAGDAAGPGEERSDAAVIERADGALGAPAELDDGTPLPLSVLARLACDAWVTRVVMGPAGEPLDVGRTQRTYTGAQRAAVVARDRTCRYPGCSAPPALCEVHHIIWWRRHGETSVSNGILLCAYHHHLVHRRDLTITRKNGAFAFSRSDGQDVGAPGASGRPDVQGASPPRSARGSLPATALPSPTTTGSGPEARQDVLALDACA